MKKMMIMLAITATSLAAAASGPKAKSVNVKINPEQSTFKWHAAKVTGEHSGIVKFKSGDFELDGNKLKGGTFTMDMTTIENTDLTGEYKGKLEGHLRSDDFFSVEKHPTSTLKIKRADPIAGAAAGQNNYNVTADLTIKGITHEVKFPAMVVVLPNEVIANAEFKIDRTKYDIRYGSKSFIQGIGDKAIDDEFDVKVRVTGSR